MTRRLQIGDRVIADDAPCFVIAELGHNHGGSLEAAKAMIHQAALCGASAVKLQKRDNQTLYSQALLDAPYEHENSYGPTYGAHRAALEFGLSQYEVCQHTARAHGVECFATAFDERSADVLAELEVPAFKVASGGLRDRPLIQHLARFQKPVLLSTGGGTFAAIAQAVAWLGDCPHAILHCTAAYPLPAHAANLRMILTLRSQYPETVIGFSSHSPGIAFSLIAYAFGARIIEQHFTLNRASKGTDHAFSLEPKGLQTLVEDLEKVRQALGDGIKCVYDLERGPLSKMTRRLTADGMRITG